MEDELDRELRDHLELEAAEQQEQGMPAEEARFAALRSLGNIASIKESSREIWGRSMFDRLLRDVRFGLRMLRHSPGFTLLVVFTLGLGIGATAAIFSVIDNVLLNPFPYADSEHLASIGIHDSSAPPNSGARDMFPETEFLDFAEQSHVFDRVMGTRPHPVLMTLGSSPPQSVNSSTMTGNALQFLGVPPLLGR
ncbi:MAG: hypothetical protein JO211_13800, partial [Acidobacteriaceae bacterium]|nr:hypothetical protein [Acidobacteriaceae bacterium]